MKLFTSKKLKYRIFSICFILGIAVLIIPIHVSKNIELPETGKESNLTIELEVDKNDIQSDNPSDGAQTINYQVSIKNNTECTETPVDSILVFDKSGSMLNLIDGAKQAGITFIDNINLAKDQSGIVAYDSSASLIQSLTNSRTDLINSINSLSAGGMTNIADGIETAKDELVSSRHNPEATTVIIIFTDGQANRPTEVDPKQYTIEKADEAKNQGIRIISIAYGNYADQNLMQEIASPGPGNYFWAETGLDMIQIYQSIAENLQSNSPDTQVSIDLSSIENIIDIESISSQGTFNQGKLNWNLGTLKCQETALLNFSIRINNNANDLDIIDLTANVSNSAGDSAESSNIITTIHAPNFIITKTDNKEEALPGESLNYSINAQNLGTGNAYNVIFEDILPEQYFELNTSSINNEGYLVTNSNSILWDNNSNGFMLDGSFQPTGSDWNNSINLSFSGNVNNNLEPGLYTLLNISRLQTSNVYTLEATDETIIPYAPDLSITKQSDPPFYTYPDGDILYTLTIKNNGNLNAENVLVTDNYDEINLSLNPNDGYVQSGNIIWTVDKLNAGETKTLTYTAKVNKQLPSSTTIIPNESTISSRKPDLNNENNSAYHELIATLDPVLEITKEADKTTYKLDEKIIYKITVTNNSNADAFNVNLNDELPTCLEYMNQSVKMNGNEFNSPTISDYLSWDLGNISVNTSIELTFESEIGDDCIIGNHLNSALINWQDKDGTNFDPISDDYTISIISDSDNLEGINLDTDEGIIENISNWARILGANLARTGETLIYIKILFGLCLALPLPLMLIFENNKNNKNKRKKKSKN